MFKSKLLSLSIALTNALLCLNTNAQNANNTDVDFYLRQFASSSLAQTYLRNSENSEKYDRIKDIRNERRLSSFGLGIGSLVGISISNNMYLEVGLTYAKKGFRREDTGLRFGDEIAPSRGFVLPAPEPALNISELPMYMQIEDRMHYACLPLSMRYSNSSKKFSIAWLFGCSFEYLLLSNQYILHHENGEPSDETKTRNTESYMSFSLSPTFGTGLDFHMNSQNTFSLMPAAQFGLLGINDSPIVGHLYNVGLEMSWIYRL